MDKPEGKSPELELIWINAASRLLGYANEPRLSVGGVQMSKFVVIVFPGESQAYQGTRALNELHAEGSLTVYGMAVISKDAQGSLSVKEAADAGPLGMAVGALVGGLVGVIGGPPGVLAGAVIGSFVDLFSYGVGADFVSKVSTELRPGKTAIVAEYGEDER